MDCYSAEIDVFEQCCHLLFGLDGFGAEAQSCGAAFYCIEGIGVSLLRIFLADVLANVPDVVVGMFAAGERKLVGVGCEILDMFKIFGTVIRFYLEAFDGFPDEFLLVIGSFVPFFVGLG